MKKAPNHAVSFAARYGSPVGGWLSAYTALARLDMLLDDAQTLSGHLDRVMPPDERWAPWFGADIISYYSVGYVTCLEWHARSRLVDLLSYRPGAVKTDDVKQLRDATLVEMTSANVTVAGMIGAATNVSTFEAYIGIFDRVFEGLGIPLKSFQVLKDIRPETTEPWISGKEIADLKRLYEFRNSLVHEIGITVLGHPNIRDSWWPEEAIRNGEIVTRMMKALEAALTRHAPNDFPNLLDAEGYPLSRYEMLRADLPKLEAQIEKFMQGFVDNGSIIDEDWEAAKAAAARHLNVEEQFLSRTLMLHSRYEDLREPLRVALVQARHTYLTAILNIVGTVEDEDQVAPAPEGK